MAEELLEVMGKMMFVLGLNFEKKESNIDSKKEEVLLNIIADMRQKLRQEKNYMLSDYVRDELLKNGISIQDKKL